MSTPREGGRRSSVSASSVSGKAREQMVREADDVPMDVKELRKVFEKIDLDNGGTLDLDELDIATRELGIKCSKNSVKKVFRMLDIDGSGCIDFEEFSAFFAKVSDPEKIKDMLSSCSAAFLDYRSRVATDPSFAKNFPMPQSVRPVMRYDRHHNSNVEAVRWMPDGRLMTATGDGRLLLWDVSKGVDSPEVEQALGKSGVYSLDTSPAGRGVLVGFGAKKDNLWLWDHEKNEVIRKYQGHGSAVYSCGLSQQSACSGNKNGEVVLSDLEREECLNSWSVHEGIVTSCSFSEDGRQILTSSRDGGVALLDTSANMPAAKAVEIEDAAAGYTVCQAIWCDRYDILSAGDDFCIKRWDIRMPKNPPLSSYMGHTACVKTIALSTDRRFFLSGGEDSSMRVWAVDADALRSSGCPSGDNSREDRMAVLLAQREEVLEKIYSGESDPSELQAITQELERMECDAKGMEDEDTNFDDGLTRASLALSGHAMSMCSLAWQDLGAGRARVASGAQDEAACVFDFNVDQILASFAR